jgi:hypothetical protein
MREQQVGIRRDKWAMSGLMGNVLFEVFPGWVGFESIKSFHLRRGKEFSLKV